MAQVTKSSSRRYHFKLYDQTATKVVQVLYNQVVTANRSRTGEVVSNWQQKIKDGQNATTPFSGYEQHVHFSPARLEWFETTQAGKPIIFTEYMAPYPYALSRAYPPELHDAAENRARIGIIKRIRSEQGSYSGMSILGELRETIQMMKHPAKAFSSMFMHGLNEIAKLERKRRKALRPRKGSKRKTATRLAKYYSKKIAEQYLEIAFGLTPLMSDISDVAEAALARIPGESLRRLSYTATESGATTVYQSSSCGSAPFAHHFDMVKMDRVQVNYTVWYKADVPGLEDQLDRVIAMGKFDLFDIIPTAYNLCPWSFLLDYISNVGDVLECLFPYNSTFKFAKRTVRSYCADYVSSRGVVRAPNRPNVRLWKFVPPTLVSSRTAVSRSAAAQIGFPGFEFSLPGFGVKYLNLAALARTVPFKT